ncbi:MAG: hypothetical protein ACYSTL_08610 [Planctomycetota bacterium]|jgi:hypothetical protein
MERDYEYAALLDIVEKLYDNDIKRIHLDRKPAEEVRAFLRRRPNISKRSQRKRCARSFAGGRTSANFKRHYWRY